MNEAEKIRAAAAKIADRWVTPIQREYGLGGAGAEIMAMPLPDMGGERFKPCRLDNSDSGITEWVFEDVAHVARPAFPEIYHFIDELVAMDDGRLVGVQFWGPATCLLPAATPNKTAEALAEVVAERDALKRDVAMMPHTLALAYKIREALGWNQYHSLDIMPDEIVRRARAQSRAAEALEIARVALKVAQKHSGIAQWGDIVDAALAVIDAAKGLSP